MIAKECCGSCDNSKDDGSFDKEMELNTYGLWCKLKKNENISSVSYRSVYASQHCDEYEPRNPVESKHEKMWVFLKKVLEVSKTYDNETGQAQTTQYLKLLNGIEKENLK